MGCIVLNMYLTGGRMSIISVYYGSFTSSRSTYCLYVSKTIYLCMYLYHRASCQCSSKLYYLLHSSIQNCNMSKFRKKCLTRNKLSFSKSSREDSMSHFHEVLNIWTKLVPNNSVKSCLSYLIKFMFFFDFRTVLN